MSGVRVYSYVDENGTTHFTDIPVDESEVAADVMTEDFYDDCGENEVQLAIRDEDGDYAVYITNLIASPVTVTLHVSHPEYVESDIDFSKIYQIGEGKTEPLGYISYSDSGVFELSFTCSIGTPTLHQHAYRHSCEGVAPRACGQHEDELHDRRTVACLQAVRELHPHPP